MNKQTRANQQLRHILETVLEKGKHEECWSNLLNISFYSDDGFEQIEAWAKSEGLTVYFDDKYRTCIFQAIQDHAIQAPPSQQ